MRRWKGRERMCGSNGVVGNNNIRLKSFSLYLCCWNNLQFVRVRCVEKIGVAFASSRDNTDSNDSFSSTSSVTRCELYTSRHRHDRIENIQVLWKNTLLLDQAMIGSETNVTVLDTIGMEGNLSSVRLGMVWVGCNFSLIFRNTRRRCKSDRGW